MHTRSRSVFTSFEFTFNPNQRRDKSGRFTRDGWSGTYGSVKAIRSAAHPDGGFSINSRTMRPLRSGFAVALNGSDRLLSASDAFGSDGKPTKAMVQLVKMKVRTALKTPRPPGVKLVLGAWHNPDDGKVEVNVSYVFPRHKRAAAERFAVEQDQIALYALHTGSVIQTGGTGGTSRT